MIKLSVYAQKKITKVAERTICSLGSAVFI